MALYLYCMPTTSASAAPVLPVVGPDADWPPHGTDFLRIDADAVVWHETWDPGPELEVHAVPGVVPNPAQLVLFPDLPPPPAPRLEVRESPGGCHYTRRVGRGRDAADARALADEFAALLAECAAELC